jgi:hypothetical protein
MALESRPLLDARLRSARQCRRSRSYRDLQGIAHTQSNLDQIVGLQWQRELTASNDQNNAPRGRGLASRHSSAFQKRRYTEDRRWKRQDRLLPLLPFADEPQIDKPLLFLTSRESLIACERPPCANTDSLARSKQHHESTLAHD